MKTTLALLCVLAGCATNNASSVDIEVNTATSEPNDTGLDVYVVASIANAGAGAGLSTEPSDFALQTTQGVFAPSELTSGEPCSPSFVEQGQLASCLLVFSIPQAAAPTRFGYYDGAGDFGSIPMPSVSAQMNVCTQVEGWVDQSGTACAQCASQAMQGSCSALFDTYERSCFYADQCSESDDLCGCISTCEGDDTECGDALGMADQCVIDACQAACD